MEKEVIRTTRNQVALVFHEIRESISFIVTRIAGAPLKSAFIVNPAFDAEDTLPPKLRKRFVLSEAAIDLINVLFHSIRLNITAGWSL
jgi:hypothetical protein